MPVLYYGNVGRAIAWLHHVFGFVVDAQYTDALGAVYRAELRVGSGSVGLAQACGPYWTPVELRALSVTMGVLVDDVDAHYLQVRQTGATITAAPEDKPWGVRQYTVDDLEGHRWDFSQSARPSHLRTPAP